MELVTVHKICQALQLLFISIDLSSIAVSLPLSFTPGLRDIELYESE